MLEKMRFSFGRLFWLLLLLCDGLISAKKSNHVAKNATPQHHVNKKSHEPKPKFMICKTSENPKGLCHCDIKSSTIDCSGEKLGSGNLVTVFEGWTGKGKHNFTVKKLILKGNDLEKITEPAKFLSRYKASIEFLDLSENKLSYLAKDTFKGFKQLKVLNLSENALRNGSVSFHSDLQVSLKELYMENNQFSFIDNTTFQNLDYLTILSLSRNQHLFKFENHPFRKMHRLVSLQLDACSFERWAPDIQLTGLSKLTHLSVQRNKLTFLPPGAFGSVPNLRTLDLAWNDLTELQPHAFAHAEHLEELKLNDLKYLWAVEQYAFAGLRRLKVLDLNDCPVLYDIDPLAFGRNVSFKKPIERIDLQNNNLATWSGSGLYTYKSVNQVKILKLNGNPWMCDCRLKWMLTIPDWVISPKQGPSCTRPSSLAGIQILSLDQSQLTCLNERHFGRAALFFLLIFTLATVMAAVWFVVLYFTYANEYEMQSPNGKMQFGVLHMIFAVLWMYLGWSGSASWSPMRLVQSARAAAAGNRHGGGAMDGPDFGYKNLILRAEDPEDLVQMEGIERQRADSLDQDAFEVVANPVGNSPNDETDVKPAFV